MELKETNHSYNCNETNPYVGGDNGKNHGRCEYDTWEDFKNVWIKKKDSLDVDDNLNHVFRFDIKEKRDSETDEKLGTFELWLFFILQRMGIYRPVQIKEITKEDMPEIEQFLKDRWEYMKDQWEEFSKDS